MMNINVCSTAGGSVSRISPISPRPWRMSSSPNVRYGLMRGQGHCLILDSGNVFLCDLGYGSCKTWGHVFLYNCGFVLVWDPIFVLWCDPGYVSFHGPCSIFLFELGYTFLCAWVTFPGVTCVTVYCMLLVFSCVTRVTASRSLVCTYCILFSDSRHEVTLSTLYIHKNINAWSVVFRHFHVIKFAN